MRPYSILLGVLLGVALIVSTLRLLFAPANLPGIRLSQRVEVYARLTFGVTLVLLALLLFLGQTLWHGNGASTAPAWAVPFGVCTIGAFLLSAAVMGGVALARRLRAS